MAGETQPVKLDMSTSIPIGSTISTGISSGQPSSIPDADTINRMASVYGLDPDVINNQIKQESSGNQSAISKKGAIGLMQLMPDTAARLGVDPHDAAANLDGGMREMSRLLTKYNGDYSKALSAYNAGENPVDKANGIPDIPETKNYVSNILKGTQYETKGQQPVVNQQPSLTGIKLDMSTSIPISQPSSQPGATTRFANAATETSSGLPADITKWPAAIRSLGIGPLSSNGQPSPSNIPLNLAKGVIKGSGAASQEGIDQFNQPGIVNKSVGAMKYVIGGLPIVGPSIVRSMDAAENGDYAGMLGTLTGLGMQAIAANPEAATSRLDAAGKYLFSKPRVQETILSGETQDMLRSTEAAARQKGHDMFPAHDDIPLTPGHFVDEIAQKALNDHITGITSTPKPIADILGENPAKFKRLGAIEGPGGGLIDIFSRMSSDQPVSMDDLHNYYTKLGEYGAKDLPGDVYAAVKDTREGIGKLIGDNYKANPDPTTGLSRFSQWEDAKSYWHDLATHWFDRDSPLRQSLEAKDPAAILRPLTGDTAERATSYLRNYTNEGGDPLAIKAAGNFYKGVNQMQLRGLLQASGGLLLSYMLRSEGAGSQIGAAAAGTLLSRRLVSGYFKTRPSLINLLSDASERPSLGRPLPFNSPPSSAFGDFNKPGGGNNPSGNPTPFTPTPIDHSASELSPTDHQFLSSIADHPSIQPDLKEDIKAITKQPVEKSESSIKSSEVTSEPWDQPVEPTTSKNINGYTIWTEPPTTNRIITSAEKALIDRGFPPQNIGKLRQRAMDEVGASHQFSQHYAELLKDAIRAHDNRISGALK